MNGLSPLSPLSSPAFTPLSLTPAAGPTPCLTRATSKSNLTNMTSYYVSDPGNSDPISDWFLEVANSLSGDEGSVRFFLLSFLSVLYDSLSVQGRKTDVWEKLKGEIDQKTLEQIENIARDVSSLDEATKNLVGYIEYRQRKGDPELAAAIAEWLVQSSLLSILEKTPQDVKQAFLDKLDSLYNYKQELSTFKPQVIYDQWIRSVITPMLSNIPSFWLGKEISGVKLTLQTFLEEQIFNPRSDFILEQKFFGIWMHLNEDKSFHLVCYSRNQERFENVPSAVEVFIPANPREISAAKISEMVQIDQEHCLKEVENHKLVASLPRSELYISSSPLVHVGTPCLLKKEAGFTSLEKSLKNLKPLERVKVCLDVLSAVEVLEKGGFVCPALEPKDILISKEGKAKLGNLFHLKSMSSEDKNQYHSSLDKNRLDYLAREQRFFSLDTARYGLVLLICEMFFLNLDEIPRINHLGWGDEILKRFKSIASPPLYKSIDEIAEAHVELKEGFLKDVLCLYSLRKSKKSAANKEDLEGEVLKQFAGTLVLFPFLSDLLETVLLVEKNRKEMVGEGWSSESIALIESIPPLEEIRAMLEEGKAKISLLQNRLA